MKKFVVGALILACECSLLNAIEPCHKDCNYEVQQARMNAENRISNVYNNKLFPKLEELSQKYQQYQDAVDKQNELLQKLQNIKKHNTLLEKQILFYRGQDKELTGLTIDAVSTKKGE